MGGTTQAAARPRRVLGATLAALACVLAVPAIAAAATTRTVAPGVSHKGPTCTAVTPCDYLWALENSTSGDTIQFESGLYAFDGAALTKYVLVPQGITLERAPGDATRPVIRQTTPFKTGFNGPMFILESNVSIRNLEIDQTATGVNNGAGAVDASAGDVIERTILTGGLGGMYATPSAGVVVMRDDLVVAGGGVAIKLEDGTMHLDNVTAIAQGGPGSGIGLLALSNFSKAAAIEATNTIARGQLHDAEASTEGTGTGSTITLHYSDARTAFELAQGSPAKVLDTDHPTHGEPLFVSATDFHEAPGSPTIDTGTADPLTGTLDLEGAARILGPAQDIGAYEFHPVPVVISSPAPATTTKKPVPAATPAPVDGALRLSHSRFRAAARGATISARAAIGTTITYSDSEAAVTTFTVLAAAPGVRSGHSCAAPPRHRRAGHRYTRCTRQVSVGSFTHADAAGTNTLHFSGRLHGARLAPRSYRLTATPRNSLGQLGGTLSAPFAIAR